MTAASLSPPPRGARPRARAAEARIEQQPGFVLHAYPWRETSLIIDTLTRDYGRVALVARGAKRPTSHFRGLLVPFSPLALSWSGRAEIKSLTRAEWLGGLAPLRGDELLSAFYQNELLERLLARGDPHETLFMIYARTLRALSLEGAERDGALRAFELDLLREIGYAPAFDVAMDGTQIDPGAWYRVDREQGLKRAELAWQDRAIAASAGAELTVRGTTVLALARRDFSDPQCAAEARGLLRHLIGYHLNGKPLNTRRILMDLRRL
ncbi:MAG TPA: DNA repair protein RecO [Burkholderiaceae bacterium]